MTDTAAPNAADVATQADALPLRGLRLIGISGAEQARRALLRSADGRIDTARVGDSLRQGVVVAIGEDVVILSSRRGTLALRMPALPPMREAA